MLRSQTMDVNSWLFQFRPLNDADRMMQFTCNEKGAVNLDLLTDEERANYFFAKTLVGCKYCHPTVIEVMSNGFLPPEARLSMSTKQSIWRRSAHLGFDEFLKRQHQDI